MNWSKETRLIHENPGRSQFGETSEAMFLTSGFVYDSAEQAQARFLGEDDGYIYSRYGNPTIRMFEQRLAALEGTETCIATSSGMAAIYAAIASQVKQGDHIIASRVLFGSCLQIITTILPKFGVDYTLVDGADLNAWQDAIRPNTKVFFCESPANPTLDLVDIKAVAGLAKSIGASFVVDNAFASPVVQEATKLGADVVVYSATKHIDGQGRCLGGAICCSEEFFLENVQHHMRHIGPGMSPFNAWVLGKAIETIGLRVTRMSENAAELASFLSDHKQIECVAYPGLESHKQYALAQSQMNSGGSLLSFKIKGGKQQAFEFLNKMQLIKISNNLGDAKTLATHPATTTHRSIEPEERKVLGISENLVRLSVGLESPKDLISDLESSLA